MTRTRAIAALVALVLTGIVFLPRASSGSDEAENGKVRVDAVFDVARGIGPRQVVKVAGAPVGTVKDVHLTRNYKARVEMEIDERFAGFRRDASCAIRPEGLLTENYIGCSPGRADAGPLAIVDGVPTVPVEHTAQPISLQDLFEIFNTPTQQRFSVLLNELGMSFAGRGEDLRAILRRANPTLAAARRAISVVNEHRAQLTQLLEDADPVVGQLARRNRDVQRFIAQTARLTRTTAGRDRELAQAIARMPALLDAARPALEELSATSRAAKPTVTALGTAAPSLERLSRETVPFADQTVRGLQAAAPVLRTAAVTLRTAAPVVDRLARFAEDADPAGRDLNRFLYGFRAAGGLEQILRIFYLDAGATNRFDKVSHVLPVNAFFGACYLYARTPQAGCDGHLDGKGAYGRSSAATRGRRRRAARPQRQAPAGPAPGRGGSPPTPAPTPAPDARALKVPLPKLPLPELPKLGPLPTAPDVPTPKDVSGLLGYLLG